MKTCFILQNTNIGNLSKFYVISEKIANCIFIKVTVFSGFSVVSDHNSWTIAQESPLVSKGYCNKEWVLEKSEIGVINDLPH